MKRREFCRTSLAAGVIAAYPFMINAAFAQSAVAAATLEGAEVEISAAAVRAFATHLDGALLMQGDTQYDSARMIWNGMWDKHPALIARCANTADVQHAVTFATEHNLLLAVRGGGHSWPGKSVCDKGLMIDLADMHTVTADPVKRRAYAQGGALLNGLDTAALHHGLVTTAGVVSHTGVGGFTLGGGFGRLNRKYGLAVDNLVSVRLVTADGQIRTVNAEQEPDLFWAVRGGGGNFGVATEFEYRLHPFDRNVLSGIIVWPIEQARAVLDFYAGWYAGLSDDLYVGPTMMTLPEVGSVVAMEVVYAGDPADGEKELAPLRAIGTPIEDGVKVQDYMVLQTHEDAALAHGVRSYAKNGMAKEFTPALADAMIESFVPNPNLMFFTHTSGGAVGRVPELATAFPHRNAETMVAVAGVWMDPAMDDELIGIARNWFKQLAPFTGGYYSNIDFDEANPGGKNYGPAYKRLSEIKGKYDPGNLFRLNRNILPAV
ncbi:MAG: FAD-binding oxidoreductase [Lysobacterales bacterium]